MLRCSLYRIAAWSWSVAFLEGPAREPTAGRRTLLLFASISRQGSWLRCRRCSACACRDPQRRASHHRRESLWAGPRVVQISTSRTGHAWCTSALGPRGRASPFAGVGGPSGRRSPAGPRRAAIQGGAALDTKLWSLGASSRPPARRRRRACRLRVDSRNATEGPSVPSPGLYRALPRHGSFASRTWVASPLA